MSIVEVLSNIESKITRFRTLNRGGCAIFAKIIADELDKRKIKYNFVFQYVEFDYKNDKITTDYPDTYRTSLNKEIIENFYISASHVMIKYNDKVVNVDGISHITCKCPRTLNSAMKQNIEESFRVRGIWNPSFNKRSIPRLKEIVQIEFSKYDEYRNLWNS